jgi:hypothetical protein
MVEIMNAYKVFVGKSAGKKTFVVTGHTQKEYIAQRS